jgi:hypothetical protein
MRRRRRIPSKNVYTWDLVVTLGTGLFFLGLILWALYAEQLLIMW